VEQFFLYQECNVTFIFMPFHDQQDSYWSITPGGTKTHCESTKCAQSCKVSLFIYITVHRHIPGYNVQREGLCVICSHEIRLSSECVVLTTENLQILQCTCTLNI